MSNRSRGALAAMACSVLVLAWSAAGTTADEPKSASGRRSAAKAADAFFGLGKVHKLHLRLSAQEWAKMQPAAPRFPGSPGTPPREPAKSADVHKGGFGMEFPWARGELTCEGMTLPEVGLRFKGNFTYMISANGLKRPWKIDLDRHRAGQSFLGLKKINLHNGQTDPSKAREVVSYAFLRAAGVPAPRTAFVEVALTVPGKYDAQPIGLYTFVEDVDKVFLKDRFRKAGGMLLKPEGLQGGLPHLGDEWAAYEQRYRPKGQPDEKQRKRLIAFTRLVNQADDARFRKEIGSYVDMEAFLRFLAGNALLANLDSFLGFGHNYYLYLQPDTDRFVFIPWDTDLSMGTWPVGGTPEQQVELSVMHPHRGQNKLIDRLLAMAEVREQYRKILRDLAATSFTKERLLKDLDAVEQAIKGPLAREAETGEKRQETPGRFGFGPGGGVFGRSMPPRKFVELRTASVASQLAGKSEGYVPPAGFGFSPPQPGAIMPEPLQNQLKLTPEQRKRFAELQKEVDGKIQEILTDEQKAQLKRMRAPRPPGPPAPPRR